MIPLSDASGLRIRERHPLPGDEISPEEKSKLVREPRRWRWHVAAAAVYCLASVLFLDHGVELRHHFIGFSADPSLIMWFLAWWPWSIAHHLDPLYTNLVWQPSGLNLSWTTCVPFMALLGLPVTLLAGPVLTYNVLTLAAPVVAGLAAYFLCLWLTRAPAASLIGGYLFGFSSYEMAQTLDHLNLDFTAFIPLLVLLMMRRLDDQIGRAKAVIAMGLCLAAQFLISVEILATAVFFGSLAWLAAIWLVPQRRHKLVALLADMLLAGLIAAAVTCPIWVAMFAGKRDLNLPFYWPFKFSNDLLSFFVPTLSTHVGGLVLYPFSSRFPNLLDEQGAYLGLPLILILCAFGRQFWHRPVGKFLLAALLGVLLASLGPQLWVGGRFTHIPMPWSVFFQLPLLSAAEPDRFSLYASLLISVIVSYWLAAGKNPQSTRIRLLIACIGCVTLIPNLHPTTAVAESPFFRPGRLQAVLGPDPRLLILPFGIHGQSSYLQQENHFGFSQTGGYLGYPPGEMGADKAVSQLMFRQYAASFPGDLQKFCFDTKTQFVVAGPGTTAELKHAIDLLGWPAKKIDDVTVYTVPGSGAIHG